MDTNLLIGIISAIALIASTSIPSILKYRTDKAKITEGQNGNPRDTIKKAKINLWLIFALILVTSSSFFLGYSFSKDCKNDGEHKKDRDWNGRWITEEEWSNGKSDGVLTIWRDKNGGLTGTGYNKNFQLSILKGNVDKSGNLSGNWKNIQTKKEGNFYFKLNNDRFEGFYELNGVKRSWTGARMNENEFTHKLNTSTIILRNKGLSGVDYNKINQGNSQLDNATRLGILLEGDKILILGQENQCYKVIAKSEQILRTGFISKTLSGEASVKLLDQ